MLSFRTIFFTEHKGVPVKTGVSAKASLGMECPKRLVPDY